MALSGSRTESSSALREFLNSPRGKAISFAAAIVMLALAGWFLWLALGPSEAQSLSRDRMFIDSKTGKAFRHELTIGEAIPIEAPSGGKTGFPAEACYWTKDGKIKKDPTWVLLKEAIEHRPVPTFCPDCGRLVIGHNPIPRPGDKPPPTEAQYTASKSAHPDRQ